MEQKLVKLKLLRKYCVELIELSDTAEEQEYLFNALNRIDALIHKVYMIVGINKNLN